MRFSPGIRYLLLLTSYGLAWSTMSGSASPLYLMVRPVFTLSYDKSYVRSSYSQREPTMTRIQAQAGIAASLALYHWVFSVSSLKRNGINFVVLLVRKPLDESRGQAYYSMHVCRNRAYANTHVEVIYVRVGMYRVSIACFAYVCVI